jgi:hypothetical protein
LSISKYKYNHDGFTRWCACGIDLACGKDRLTEKERPMEENEGDTDLRSVRISEGRRSEEGVDIKGKIKRRRHEFQTEDEVR